MNPYNQPYGAPQYHYEQHTPGPPQPSWQGPPRRQGWFDPRAQEQQQQQQQAAPSPVSLYQNQQSGYPPAPFPPPPPPTQSPRPPIGHHDTSRWGVKFNQHQAPQSEDYRPQWNEQSEEYRPPLPPRPSSSTAHHGPAPPTSQPPPHYGSGPPTSQSIPHYGPAPTSVSTAHYDPERPSSVSIPHHGAAPQSTHWHPGPGAHHSPRYPSQPAISWQDPYQNQSQPSSYDIPPPPPPRPPEYQAQIQSQYQTESLPHQYYSHHPASHQYDPGVSKPQTPTYPPQQHGMTFAPPERPSHSAYPSSDHALVSPIESETQHWPQQPPITGAFGGEVLQAPKPEDHFYSSALGMGGPSDWEHLGDSQSLSPEMSSPPQAAAIDSHGPNMSSPPQMPADVVQTLPGYHEPAQPAAQDHAGSSLPDHPDSDTSYAPVQGINRTGTIDSVIQAWNVPLSVSAKPVQRLQSRPESRENIQGQPLERVVEVEKIVEKVVDPYSDLEPEFKASLKRYVAMLRKETAAATEEAKFEIFQAFIRKELRLRSMLYGVEVQDLSANGTTVNPTTRAVNDIPVLQEQMSAARAVAPSVASHTALAVEPPLLNARSSPNKHQDSAAHGNTEQLELKTLPKSEPQRGGISEDSKASPARPATPPPPLKLESLQLSHQAKDESVVVVDADDGDVEFSPGGRPRISRPQVVTNRSEQPAAGAAATAPDTQGSRLSPSADAPMVLEDYVMAGPPSPGANAPMLIEPNSATDLPQVVTDGYGPVMDHAQRQAHSATEKKSSGGPAINFEPSRPAYQPFKYNPAVQAPTQPADESYSSLRKDAVDSGRLLVHEPLRPSDSLNGSRTSSPGLSRPQDEAFIGLIRSQSKAIRSKKPVTSDISTLPQLRPGTPRAPTLAAGTQAPKSSDLTTATSALRSMLPDSVPDSYGLSQHAKATALKAKVDAFSDNFSFIHETVVHWDRENRKVRVKQDEERNARQADSEAHIDGLFNDNEIGYADIGDLEADFKLVEAERKYQEDQQELEFFTREVYQPVTDRLQKELSELNTEYTLAVDLLDLESEPASRFLRPDSGKAEMGYVMSCVLSLFNKLELRHQKIAEADVERERRRKRLELTVLYTNGDNQGVRKLDQEFAVAEKMQVLHEARTKDTRANKLMDSFDRATVRGLGDNQTFVDDLLDRVRQLKEVILKDPANISQEVYAPQGPRDTMTLAQKAIDFVLADSQKLLTVSNVADKMLNEADYAVSVAEARVSNAEQATYDKLAHEKEKEDAKIVEDTNARMSSIGKAPADAVALIREVVDKVGDDAEHQERIMKALEAAKQRNAVTEAG